LLLVAPAGAGEHYHGAGTTFFRMYSQVPREQLRISLVHGAPAQSKSDVYDEQVFLGKAVGHASLRDRLSQIQFIHRAKSWIKSNAHRFDVVHAATAFPTALVPTTYAASLGLPVAVTIAIHHGDLGGRLNLLRKLMGARHARRRMIQKANAVLATSEGIWQELLEFGVSPDRIHRIPYAVDTALFSPIEHSDKSDLRERLGLAELPTFLLVGGIIPRKRQHLLLEALAQLVDESRQPCQVVFVGPDTDQDYARRAREFVQARGLERHVTWAGFHTDISPWYRAADVFVLPSRDEGLPNSMLEAMAAGLPAIGTRISGINDLIIPDENGFIVAAEAGELARAMARYLDDPGLALRHGAMSRDIAVQDYSYQAVIPKYLSLFAQLKSQRTI
jgi:glycosyltransferase involved in cell wall biosynthesis